MDSAAAMRRAPGASISCSVMTSAPRSAALERSSAIARSTCRAYCTLKVTTRMPGAPSPGTAGDGRSATPVYRGPAGLWELYVQQPVAAARPTSTTVHVRRLTTPEPNAVRTGRSVHLEHRQKRFLRDLHRAHLLHPLLSLFLLLEQLALAGHVAAVALRRDVLAQRADRFPGDHLRADRGLDHHLEQLSRDQLAQLLRDLLAPLVRLVAVDDHRERVHGVAVEQHVQLDEVRRPVLQELVVQRGVAARDRLQLVVEIEDDFGERELPGEVHAGRVHVVHAPVYPAALLTQLHDRADVFRRRDDPRLYVRLLDALHGRAV